MTTKVPLLLLPGLLCDYGVWQSQLDALTGVAATAVPDLSAYDSIATMASEVLRQFPGCWAIAGHSMGGRVALEIQRRAPERVLGLALINTGFTPKAAGEEQKRQPQLDLARESGLDALATEWIPPLLSPTNERRAAVLSAFRVMARRLSVPVFENHIRALLNRPDATAVLPLIRSATVLICGRQDAKSALATHERMAEVIGNSHLVAIDDCGHLAPMEAPTTVNVALQEWLREIGRTHHQTMKPGVTA